MLGAFTLRVIFLGATIFNFTEEQLFNLKQKAFMNAPFYADPYSGICSNSFTLNEVLTSLTPIMNDAGSQ